MEDHAHMPSFNRKANGGAGRIECSVCEKSGYEMICDAVRLGLDPCDALAKCLATSPICSISMENGLTVEIAVDK